MPLSPRRGQKVVGAVKWVPRFASGLAFVVATVLSVPLVPLLNRRRHVREARRLGLDQGRVVSRTMTGNAFAPATLHVVSVRDGPWRAVLAAVTAQAAAVGYARDTERDWAGPARNLRYVKRGKMLSILEVSAFPAGQTIAGSHTIVPDGQTGLRFELQANK